MLPGNEMTHSEKLRQTLFWFTDSVKGGYVSTYTRELELFDKKKIDDTPILKKRLTGLLNHAIQNVPFYASYRNWKSLYDFPIINKKILKNNFNNILSSAYKINSLITGQTSGSYGTPFTFYFTKQKKVRKTAEIIHYNKKAGFELGMNHAHIALRTKSSFELFLQNQILIKPVGMGYEWSECVWNIFKEKNLKVIIGYTSALLMLAEWLETREKPDSYRPKVVIAIAEPLGLERRLYLEEQFGSTVISRYACTEAGLIAQERIDDRRFYANNLSLILEVVSMESDKPVKPGETGRLLITDLYSHAMPLIRYDIGDIVKLSADSLNERRVTVLDSVEGRSVEIITSADGKMISPIAIDDVFDGLVDINRFQFIQKDKCNYLVRLIAKPVQDRDACIARRLHSLLGNNISVKYEYVNDIPTLPSGKRPYVINEGRSNYKI
jgi:phenylacetate-CoA ligase